MRWSELVHAIRSCYKITKETSYIIIGSQSVLGLAPNPPDEMLKSCEIDIIMPNSPKDFDKLNGALGEYSVFHTSHNFYVDGIDSENVRLPSGYISRMVHHRLNIEDEDSTLVDVDFISLEDMIASKLLSGREKDLKYIGTAKTELDIDSQKLMTCLSEMNLSFDEFNRLVKLYEAA